ncbi:50S ribosomal protein L9 [bioreactor metagenome]|uniref:50S ribosomal protein L9 n=1 Tax=bioreactor metagenome TaxID=1076179 RepID=A0A645FSD8_9ZZZZ
MGIDLLDFLKQSNSVRIRQFQIDKSDIKRLVAQKYTRFGAGVRYGNGVAFFFLEVILKEDIISLGYKDDVVNVKKGYARNFLIPQGKAVIASESAKKVLAENQKQRAHKLAQIKADAQAIADKLEGVSLTIGAKASSTGTIFGSVTNIQIADALQAKGFEIERKLILIKDAVKEVGTYKAVVKLHKEVSVEIPFEVVAE